MTTPITKQATIQRLRIQNYRVLRDVQFSDLTPLTVLLGPNGSGKSTVFDVFAFLHDAFTTNLRAAGGLLGNLWMEGYFEAGDPLVRGGKPRTRASA